ncbi:MAG: hypothetical protein U9R48_11645 [Chloroflexota bacterium]|nr:hypothetical protein [Chloroflexota bacterium]
MDYTYTEKWPEIVVHVYEEDGMQPGLTLVNLSNHAEGVPITAVVIDPHGEVVWSYRRYSDRQMWGRPAGNAPDLRGDVDVRTTDEGVLIGGTNITEGTARIHAALVSL